MSNDYLLFKQVFNNIFLCKEIFKIVRYKNRQISNSNYTNKSFLQRCRYDQASFQWCLKNKHYQLLYDKVRNGIHFNENTDQYCTYQNLKTFIQQVQLDHDEQGVYSILNKFYQIHNEHLLSIPYLNKETGFIDISLLPFSIFTQCLPFVEIVFTDNKKRSPTSTFDQLCEFDKENTILNGNLLDTACRLGNLQIIKYLHQTVGLQFSNEKAIFNSLISDNRDEIIEYLLNEVNYIPPTSYTGSNEKSNQFKDHYENLLKLDFTLFKRLHQLNFPILFNEKQHNQLLENCCLLIINQKTRNINDCSPSNQVKLTFKSFVNVLQSLLYLSDSLKNTKTIDTTTLKKIENVIYYNNNNNKCIKVEQQQQQQHNNNIGGNSLLSNFKSILGISPTSTSKDKMIGIVYENFNFKREIIRIFIYDYLNQFKRKSNIKEETWLKLILKFASKYNEHHLIETENVGTKFHQNVYSKSYPMFITQSLKKADSKLVEIMVKLFQDSDYRSIFTTNQDDGNTGRDNFIRHKKARDHTYLNNHFFNHSKKHLKPIKLEQVIQFISVMFKYPLIFSKDQKESVLIYLVESPLLTIEQSDQIANIIKPIKFSATILIENEIIFKHYYFKHNNLFNWSNESTSKRIIEIGNLNLIAFCKQYNIGSINESLSINHCKTIKVAKYMYEELNFKFTNIQINSITQLNELESGYLFYYAIDKIVKDYDPSLSINKITVGSSYSNNLIHNQYNQIKYLETIYIKYPYLFSSEPDQVNYESYFKQLYDVNTIIGFGNLKYIVNFFKEYSSSSEKQNYNLDFKSESINFVQSIDKLNHNQSNDKFLYILNFCKDNKLKTYF